ADGDLAFLAVVRGRLLARLARAQHAPLGIELVERLGDAVVVELGGKLDARATGPDHLRDNRFDLLPQAPLEGRLALLAVAAATRPDPFGGAVGQEIAGLIDDRDPLWLEPVDRRSREVADRADLLRLQRA